jgi:hypothetical protein
MSNEESGLGAARRTPRQGVGGSPVGSWLTIALAVIAVVAGFLILRNINDDSTVSSPNDATAGQSDAATDATGDTLVNISIPVTESTTTTTTIVRTTEGASVVVANANTVGGSAGGMTRTLELAGYDMIDPVNASGPNLIASIVYFDGAQASAEAVAQSVALDLGGVEVLPVSTPAPTAGGDLGEAGVLVLLGDDQAGKTLEELAPAAGGVAAPDPSDGEVPVTAPADADTGGDADEEVTEE